MSNLVVAPIDFRADAPDADRHAFPRVERAFPPGSICGQVRWTVRMRPDHGARFCPECVTAIREELGWLILALTTVDAAELGAGNHFAGMPR